MRILLVHPEDSPRCGSWAEQRWDLVVDLGLSSETTAESWRKELGCSVVRLSAFRRSIEDPIRVGEILQSFNGSVRDRSNLDWWEICSPVLQESLQTALPLRRLAVDDSLSGELYATRADWPVSAFCYLLGRDLHVVGTLKQPSASQVRRLASRLHRLQLSSVWQIVLDKYDGAYRWRRWMAESRPRCSEPLVLLPSAYTNVSRSAAAYARTLPEQKFLLVATRQSAYRFDRPPNVEVVGLGAFAEPSYPRAELSELLNQWQELRRRLIEVPELRLLENAGILEHLSRWLTDGLAVRDAWNNVFVHEPVRLVLCGDDSNPYTRLPVELARLRGIPTVDYHHGAFDGRFLAKRLPSDIYFAKGEMERDYLTRICGMPADRIVVAPPQSTQAPDPLRMEPRQQRSIVFFSEPYEVGGGRPEEVYREVLPALTALAQEHGRELVVKLHPFENAAERTRFVQRALGRTRAKRVRIISGPLAQDLLASAWFGITVESSTVVDCTRHGVPCFLCEWLVTSCFGYVQQFARFGIGRLLHSPGEFSAIPRMLAEWDYAQGGSLHADASSTAETLRELLKAGTVSAAAHSQKS